MKGLWFAKGAIALGVFGIGINGVAAELGMTSGPLPLVNAKSAFLGWLFGTAENQDANENPRTKRGDDFCLVTFEPGIVNPLWSDRPRFLIQGEPRSLALYRDGEDEPFWTYSVNSDEAVTYAGVPLRPGVVYTLRAEHAQFPASQYEERQLVVVSTEEQMAIALDLMTIEEEMQQAGATAEAIALARADYFWQQGLATDAWEAILPWQTTSPDIAEALQKGYEKLCGP